MFNEGIVKQAFQKDIINSIVYITSVKIHKCGEMYWCTILKCQNDIIGYRTHVYSNFHYSWRNQPWEMWHVILFFTTATNSWWKVEHLLPHSSWLQTSTCDEILLPIMVIGSFRSSVTNTKRDEGIISLFLIFYLLKLSHYFKSFIRLVYILFHESRCFVKFMDLMFMRSGILRLGQPPKLSKLLGLQGDTLTKLPII